jgi:hypothetical protein
VAIHAACGLPRFARNDEGLRDCGKVSGHCDARQTRHCEAQSAVAIHVPVIPATPPVSAYDRRRMDCHGPSALAMTGWEVRHCEAQSAVAIHTACGLPRFARNDEDLKDCGEVLGHCDALPYPSLRGAKRRGNPCGV